MKNVVYKPANKDLFWNNINTFSPIFHSHWYMSIRHTSS